MSTKKRGIMRPGLLTDKAIREIILALRAAKRTTEKEREYLRKVIRWLEEIKEGE